MGRDAANYPTIGLYKGRYRLHFGPGVKMQYTVPGEGVIPGGMSVKGNRIAFLPAGGCRATGTYAWRVEGTTLTFRKLSEGCPKRVVQLVRRWTRVG